MNEPPILSVCLNPAFQKLLSFCEFHTDSVNRAVRKQECAGGKGINTARALQCINVPSDILLFQGGDAGTKTVQHASDVCRTIHSIETKTETRTCITAIDLKNNSATELIEPSGIIDKHERNQMATLIETVTPEYDGIMLCGSRPPGAPASLYAKAAASALGIVILDAFHDAYEIIPHGVDILKINAQELQQLTGEAKKTTGIKNLLKQTPLNAVAVTDEHNPALLGTKQSIYELSVPDLSPIISPIGAGDCCTAVFMHAMLTSEKISNPVKAVKNSAAGDDFYLAAFTKALTAASASCCSETPACFDQKIARKANGKIFINKLP